MPPRPRAFSLLELLISLAVVTALLAVLIPTLTAARETSDRNVCASNLKWWGAEWATYLEDHAGQFPHIPVQPEWRYAGVRFSTIDERAFIDTRRPLSRYLHTGETQSSTYRPGHRHAMDGLIHHHCCPADRGITGAATGVGTGDRSAFRAFGISYRANHYLLNTPVRAKEAGLRSSLNVSEIVTAPSRLVLMGDPVWYEVHERTRRDAAWHGAADRGNLLFLDGAVKFSAVRAKSRGGPVVFEPRRVSARP